MKRSCRNACLALFAFLQFTPAHGAQALPKCSQDHPGQQHRRESLLKRGDSRMTFSAAGHATKFAVERFRLQDLVTEADIERVSKQMYDFLVWKLGSPTAAASQWLTAGYQHFDKGYSDEAAGMLLGVIDFQKKDPELKLPKWMQDYIKAKVAESGEGIATALTAYGVPEPLAKLLGGLAEKELAKIADRNTVGVFMPKSFDVDNRLVDAAIAARRSASRSGSPAASGAGPKTGLPGNIRLPGGTKPRPR